MTWTSWIILIMSYPLSWRTNSRTNSNTWYLACLGRLQGGCHSNSSARYRVCWERENEGMDDLGDIRTYDWKNEKQINAHYIKSHEQDYSSKVQGSKENLVVLCVEIEELQRKHDTSNIHKKGKKMINQFSWCWTFPIADVRCWMDSGAADHTSIRRNVLFGNMLQVHLRWHDLILSGNAGDAFHILSSLL